MPELARRVRDLHPLRLGGVWSHFAVADTDPEFTRRQVETFELALRSAEPALPSDGRTILRHLANTPGTLFHPESHLDMVRTGLGIYGLYPHPSARRLIDLCPAMRIVSHVSHVLRHPEGARPSYGRIRPLPAPSAVATLPLGYADGIPRGISEGGEVLIRGRRFSLAGRVTMDQLVVDEIIFVGAQPQDNRQFQEVLKLCEELGIRTRIAADFFPTSTSRVSLDFLEELPLITFSTAPDQSVALVVKRIMDCVLASALLALAAPFLLLIMGLIKFTSPGSVFYRQVRRGLYGREFRLVKFRSMVEGAEDQLREIRHLNEMDGPVFKMRKDPRVTPLGRILRRYSIDELPQLANVLRGEMSLVGPRAPLPEEVRHYSRSQRRRLSVKPGITCLWQISGRNELDFEKWMKLDLQYIDQWSLKLDLWILLKTIPAVVWGRGAS